MQQRAGKTNAYRAVRVALFAVCALFAALWNSAIASPAWWTARGVLETGSVVSTDYAPVNLGQLKWMATNACAELDEKLVGGAGSAVHAIVDAFSTSNNYVTASVGQLKHVAKPFYDRLIAVGYTNSCPWTATYADDLDWAIANIGQLKRVFDFAPEQQADSDADGMSDEWEMGWFGDLTHGPSADEDGDGLTNLEESLIGANPGAFDTDGDLIADPEDPNPTLSSDSDADGLPDDWETHWFGGTSETGDGDYDGDGIANGEEFRAGTDPTRWNDDDKEGTLSLQVFTPQE